MTQVGQSAPCNPRANGQLSLFKRPHYRQALPRSRYNRGMLRVVSLISSVLILLIGAMGIVLDAALAIDNALDKGPRHFPLSTFPMVGIPLLGLGCFLLFASRVNPPIQTDPLPSRR
jgi:hypothetical protein